MREQSFLQAVSSLAYANPFLPERVQFEKQALGAAFEPGPPVWSAESANPDRPRANVWKIAAKLEPIVERMAGNPPADPQLYEDAVLHLLYQRYYPHFAAGKGFAFYRQFLADWRRYSRERGQPSHVFACFYQIQRAFHAIFDHIIGASMPAARLRATVWQSIFTHDMRRYRRTFYRRMGDYATLITGPSGTGKELVARAIAQARYLPFDETKLTFAAQPPFHPIHIASLSSTLIESELFGHRKGSFTGAIADRRGWLEVCPPLGSVFLDELGEMEPGIQVKLLRVIETRTFHAVGDAAPRRFEGKLIAATNRDLAAEIAGGRFREDLYYRLCSDIIQTPSLADQIRESPPVLEDLVRFFLRRLAPEESGALVDEVLAALPAGHTWPGNYRELEQAIRNILIRRTYHPLPTATAGLNADELIGRQAAQLYAACGSYQETARRLNLDRRTVKAKIEAYLKRSL
jgi:hypothetical protein